MKEVQDHFFRLAKEEGYRARSAYKLTEIDDRFKLMRAGSRVLDLGCGDGTLLAHLIKARLVATGAGFDRTNTLIEQALCTVMREYRGADHDDAISQAAALDARVA